MAFHLSGLTSAAFLEIRRKNYAFAGCNLVPSIHSCVTTTTSTARCVYKMQAVSMLHCVEISLSLVFCLELWTFKNFQFYKGTSTVMSVVARPMTVASLSCRAFPVSMSV